MAAMARYGRGKFEAAPEYVAYMETIVEHPNYAEMPNAISNGRVNWQVSSGRNTSFFEYYEPRWQWWAAKADSLDLPGSGNEQERFTIAARLIHPTGYRPCRLCGLERNVGYFYANANFAKRLNRDSGSDRFEKSMAVDNILALLAKDSAQFPSQLFPERHEYLTNLGVSTAAFETSNHLRSSRLSPGFMGNPPDRLDGFHDYCVFCRAKNDPGRSEDNLRSYNHDRRAFEYWTEGDWGLADALFNSAGPGSCSICGKQVSRVSPDHIGPLACGFKHQPFFAPTCQNCNSAKNRRMRARDVELLLESESLTGTSAASRHVRELWDANKFLVTDDKDARELAAAMRALLDFFLRGLHVLSQSGQTRLIVTLLNPDYAFYQHEFAGLDPGQLTYREVRSTPVRTQARESLACRSVRIALDSLAEYAAKPFADRKLRGFFLPHFDDLVSDLSRLEESLVLTDLDDRWNSLRSVTQDSDAREIEIGRLLASGFDSPNHEPLEVLLTHLDSLGRSAEILTKPSQ
jgi:Alw26I/Eco31I/Esp3I family type II restriction endonuclease